MKFIVSDTAEFSDIFGPLFTRLDTTRIVIVDYINAGVNVIHKLTKDNDQLLQAFSDPDEASRYEQQDHFPRKMEIHTLNNLYLYSGLVFLHSQFEYHFKEIARIAGNMYKTKIRFENYKNKCKKYNRNIFRPKYFLIDNIKNTAAVLDSNWTSIEYFNKIRNCYVHDIGLNTNDKKLVKYIEEEPSLKLYGKELVISKEYVLQMVDILFPYLRNTMNSVYNQKA